MSDTPLVTVYLQAAVRDHAVKGSKRKHAWTLRLQRWPPEEVYRVIVETFEKMARTEDDAAREAARKERPKLPEGTPACFARGCARPAGHNGACLTSTGELLDGVG